jgi:hypothetical protein
MQTCSSPFKISAFSEPFASESFFFICSAVLSAFSCIKCKPKEKKGEKQKEEATYDGTEQDYREKKRTMSIVPVRSLACADF